MKLKHLIYILIGYIAWLAYKAYKAYNYLTFSFSSVYLPEVRNKKLTKEQLKQIIKDWLDSYANIGVVLELNNFSDKSYKVKNYYIELYTPDGRFIAQPENPEQVKAFEIKPKDKLKLSLDYGVDLTGLGMLFSQIEGFSIIDKAFKAVSNYVKKGELGVKVVLKGSMQVRGIPIDIPINYTTTI